MLEVEAGTGESWGAGKKARMVWTSELHHRFVEAVAHLGDKGAVPKAIMRPRAPSPIVPDSVSTIGSRRLDLSASPLADPEAAAFASPRGGGRVTAGFVICFPNYSSFLSKPGLYVEAGRMVLSAVAGRAAELGMGRVEFQSCFK